MSELDKISIPEKVMARLVGDELVLLDLANGAYFGLNPVATRFWQLVSEGKTLSDTQAVLVAEFDAPAETIARDLQLLVKELVAAGLVVTQT